MRREVGRGVVGDVATPWRTEVRFHHVSHAAMRLSLSQSRGHAPEFCRENLENWMYSTNAGRVAVAGAGRCRQVQAGAACAYVCIPACVVQPAGERERARERSVVGTCMYVPNRSNCTFHRYIPSHAEVDDDSYVFRFKYSDRPLFARAQRILHFECQVSDWLAKRRQQVETRQDSIGYEREAVSVVMQRFQPGVSLRILRRGTIQHGAAARVPYPAAEM